MSKKSRQHKKVWNNHLIIFWVSKDTFSSEANKHITRSVEDLLKAADATPKKFMHKTINGKEGTVFQVSTRHKDLVKEICKKYSIDYYFSFFQSGDNAYTVFKDSVTSPITTEGIGYYTPLTKEEALKAPWYLYDKEGHYFTVIKKPIFTNLPVKTNVSESKTPD